MSKTKAIKRFCLECVGDSPLSVTLCGSFDCPLWPWRLGASAKTKAYKARLEGAMRNHPEFVKDLSEVGVDVGRFSLKQHVSALWTKDLGRMDQTTGTGQATARVNQKGPKISSAGFF
jgi:hypothetical protein